MNTHKKTINRKKILFILPVAALALVLLASSLQPATAHAKTTYYYTCMNGQKSGVKEIKVTDSGKIIIKGTFSITDKKGKAIDDYFGKNGIYGKYVFRTGKNFKCYAVGGLSEPQEYTLEVFKKDYAPKPNLGLGLMLKVRNGKLVELRTES